MLRALHHHLDRSPLLLLLLGLAGCAGGGPAGPDVGSRLRVAAVAEASGQPEIALSVLSSLALAAPDNAEVQARYARSLALAGKIPDSDAVVTRALRRNAGNPRLLQELGRVKLLDGKPGEALNAFRQILERQPADV